MFWGFSEGINWNVGNVMLFSLLNGFNKDIRTKCLKLILKVTIYVIYAHALSHFVT